MLRKNRKIQKSHPQLALAGQWLCLALALLAEVLFSQAPPSNFAAENPFDEVGHFYLESWTPQEYGASEQNWSLIEDDRGLLYVGNSDGVLEFDGVTWRLIPTANRSLGRSLNRSSEGRILVGASADFGFLAPDSTGKTHYVSLIEKVPEEDRDFSDVWEVHVLSDGIYFGAYERLFRWRDGQIDVWRPEDSFARSFVVRDTLYVQTQAGDLLRMDAGELHPAPGGTSFRGKRLAELLPYGPDAFLAVTRKHGLLRCSQTEADPTCEPFRRELTDLLSELETYSATILPEGLIALGTVVGGWVLLDQNGRLLRIMNEASGLPSQTVWATFVDRQGGLWLGLNNGLARIEVSASLSFFDKTLGMSGNASSIVRHQGRLYVATSLGVYVLESAGGSAAPARFVLASASTSCWWLLSTEQGLLAGCKGGVFNLDRERLIWAYPDRHVMHLHRSKKDSSRLLVGLENGLGELRLRDGLWGEGRRLPGISAEVRSIVEDDQGQLFLGTQVRGVLRLKDENASEIQALGVANGLPPGWLNTHYVGGELKAVSRSSAGLFRLDPEATEEAGSPFFVPDTTLLPPEAFPITELVEDDQGRVWFVAGADSGVALPTEGGRHRIAPTILRRPSKFQAYTMLAESDGAVWIGGNPGMIRLDSRAALVPEIDYPVWIRGISSAGTNLYGGEKDRLDTPPSWPHGNEALRFVYAAPRYQAPKRTQYRTRLEGFDDDWSDWSLETTKDYTNLWEGRYVFRVQARDVFGVVSQEDSFAFRILPPWYRSLWAYGLYALALIGLVLTFLRSHRAELQRERSIAERERQANQRLREADQLKDEFLASTSHELRTPLYGITGLAESLYEGACGELPEKARANLALLAASGHRLTNLVNDILDFSKLKHQSLELHLEPVDLHALSDVVLTLSAPLAADKGLELVNQVDSTLPEALADINRVQQILHNLVGNAIKYTEKGKVEVSAAVDAGRLKVSVHDTGVGIPAEQLDTIFAPFVQLDASIRRQGGGTGLGLAVTKKLVELHGGILEVESQEGEGSVFSFSLPLAPEREATVTRSEASSSEIRPQGLLPIRTLEPVKTETAGGLISRSDLEFKKPHPDGQLYKILVVDDEPIVRQVLDNHLSPEGYRVLTASSGPEALSLLEQQDIDLLLLDIMMPKLSGYEVCRALRKKYPLEALPILFLSAMNRTADRTAGLDLGGNDYIAKPIARTELLSRVKTHLELLAAHRRQEKEVVTLRGLLPICAHCKKIRDDDDGSWSDLEEYISTHSDAQFSHGICPTCVHEIYPDFRGS